MSKNATALGAERATRACPQGVARRKLADISNMPHKPQGSMQEEKLQCGAATTKEYIEQLQKENMALVKLLAQRNKIVEQSGIELDRMRVNFLKLQEQNRQLALHNTQMLVDLNSGKDRLKALHHELGCKNGLLKARQLEIEERAQNKTCKCVETKDDDKTETTKKTVQPKGLGSPEQVLSMDAETKRPFKRRQSARFKAAEAIPTEDLCKGDDAESLAYSMSNDSIPEKESTSANPSVKIEEKEFSSDTNHESQSSGRLSLSRPSRVAAKKVQSYKEKPLNVKMRRPG